MSLYIAVAIAGASILVGLLIAVAEQMRALLRRRSESVREAQHLCGRDSGQSRLRHSDASPNAARPTPETRAAAYREILDALGEDFDDDIAEWEAVLHDFPQVIGAEDLVVADDDSEIRSVGAAHEAPAAPQLSTREPITPLHRTRSISAEERGMIVRLLKTGFAPEEIALWLNLPLERVQEVLLCG